MSCLPTAAIADHLGGFTHVRVRIANGSEQIRQQCRNCEELVGIAYGRSRFTDDQIAAMPIVSDWTRTRPPCVRCGAWGTEEHHWAPRSVFGEEGPPVAHRLAVPQLPPTVASDDRSSDMTKEKQ